MQKMTTEQQIALLEDKNARFGVEVFLDAVCAADKTVRAAALRRDDVPEAALMAAIRDGNAEIREAAAKHRNATAPVLHFALGDDDEKVRTAAVLNRNAGEAILVMAMDDDSDTVRAAAVQHPAAGRLVFFLAEIDGSPLIRKLAQENDNYSDEMFAELDMLADIVDAGDIGEILDLMREKVVFDNDPAGKVH